MLLFHAILFFLFGTCAVAVPILGKISDALGFSTPVEKQASGVWSFRVNIVLSSQPVWASHTLIARWMYLCRTTST
ncbi:hypothetical protein F5887DRAFT_1003311 [Amanita rubescens]|nr:hypothetical protein F5887DRAFT_1003311 [Amanita rubescens]